jgi:hypothetical protein
VSSTPRRAAAFIVHCLTPPSAFTFHCLTPPAVTSRVSAACATSHNVIRRGLADVIGVAGNPLDDLRTLQQVRFVMKDGQVFKR